MQEPDGNALLMQAKKLQDPVERIEIYEQVRNLNSLRNLDASLQAGANLASATVKSKRGLADAQWLCDRVAANANSLTSVTLCNWQMEANQSLIMAQGAAEHPKELLEAARAQARLIGEHPRTEGAVAYLVFALFTEADELVKQNDLPAADEALSTLSATIESQYGAADQQGMDDRARAQRCNIENLRAAVHARQGKLDQAIADAAKGDKWLKGIASHAGKLSVSDSYSKRAEAWYYAGQTDRYEADKNTSSRLAQGR